MKLDALATPDAFAHVPFDVEKLRSLELAVDVRIEEAEVIAAFGRVEPGMGGAVHAAPRFFAR